MTPARILELAIIAYRKKPNRRNERRLIIAEKNFTNVGRI